MEADLVITNGKVISVDKDFSIKQAVAVKEGKIVSVGTNDEVKPFIGSNTKVLDLQGKPILPGINESHMHPPFFGATRPPLAIDLTFPAVKAIPDMVEALRKKVSETAPGEWIRGFGWDQSSLAECQKDPSILPRKWDLDAVHKGLFDWAEEFVSEGQVVWDVGANLGLFTFAAAYRAGPSGFVVAVEPDTFLVDLLRRTATAQKGLGAQTVVLPVAASGSIGIQTLCIPVRCRASNYLETAGGRSQTGGVRETVSVMTVTSGSGPISTPRKNVSAPA